MTLKNDIAHALITGMNDEERGYSCPVCGGCLWGYDHSPKSEKYITASCQLCGYVGLFDAEVLQRKKEELLAQNKLDLCRQLLNEDRQSVNPGIKSEVATKKESENGRKNKTDESPKGFDFKVAFRRFFDL